MSFALRDRTEPTLLLRKLQAARLAEPDIQAFLDLPLTVRALEPRCDIVRCGARPTHCSLLLDGFAGRYKILPDGKRQITGFYVPGDLTDLQTLHLPVMDTSICTFANSTVAMIPHQSLRDLLRRCPAVANVLWRDTLVEAARFREWMTGIGRRTAYQRIAHLMCELQVRLDAAGAAEENGYPLPVTQTELGDALGLTTVHVNRILQDLRADGLIVLRGGYLTIPDRDSLRAAAEFDPAYLHLND